MDSTHKTKFQPLSPPTKGLSYISLLFLGSALILISGVTGYYLGIKNPPSTTLPNSIPTPIAVGCTMEAKLCPDGSTVGRRGPKCEFDRCPEVRPTAVPTTGVCVTGGCSGELCLDTSQEGLASTCQYKDEYA